MGVIKENCSCFGTDEAASQFTLTHTHKKKKKWNNQHPKKSYKDESALFRLITCIARLKVTGYLRGCPSRKKKYLRAVLNAATINYI